MKKNQKRTELSGMLGESVTVRKVNNRVVVTNRPPRPRMQETNKQEATKQRFREAVQYSKQQLTDDTSRALYEAAVPEKGGSARTLAVADYLNAPKVREIDPSEYQGMPGDVIAVKATDDFMVTAVTVQLKDKYGKLLEKGEATPDTRINYWLYTASTTNPSRQGTTIRVTAVDRPGNRTVEEMRL